jgi:hypothetical protein
MQINFLDREELLTERIKILEECHAIIEKHAKMCRRYSSRVGVLKRKLRDIESKLGNK